MRRSRPRRRKRRLPRWDRRTDGREERNGVAAAQGGGERGGQLSRTSPSRTSVSQSVSQSASSVNHLHVDRRMVATQTRVEAGAHAGRVARQSRAPITTGNELIATGVASPAVARTRVAARPWRASMPCAPANSNAERRARVGAAGQGRGPQSPTQGGGREAGGERMLCIPVSPHLSFDPVSCPREPRQVRALSRPRPRPDPASR
jgi:hypothetical protein